MKKKDRAFIVSMTFLVIAPLWMIAGFPFTAAVFGLIALLLSFKS